MAKKIVIVCIIVVFFSLFYFFTPKKGRKKSIPEAPYVYRLSDKTAEINVTECDENSRLVNPNKISYASKKYRTSFQFFGIYGGEIFQYRYKRDGKVLMKIDPLIDPADGIVNGFASFNFIDEELKVVIFLDEDWKVKVKGKTYIIWGDDFQNSKEFSWKEISPGIYMDSVLEEDVNRFKREVIWNTDANVAIVNVNFSKFKRLAMTAEAPPKDLVSITIK